MRLKSINGSSWASIVSSKRYRYSYDSLKSVRAAIEILNQVSRARLRQSGQAVSLIQRRPTTPKNTEIPLGESEAKYVLIRLTGENTD